MSKKAERIVDTQTSTETTEDRAKVEVLVDELLDKVTGGMELCQHCNQPCGDCVQPPPPTTLS
jgi:hypothetical protein